MALVASRRHLRHHGLDYIWQRDMTPVTQGDEVRAKYSGAVNGTSMKKTEFARRMQVCLSMSQVPLPFFHGCEIER